MGERREKEEGEEGGRRMGRGWEGMHSLARTCFKSFWRYCAGCGLWAVTHSDTHSCAQMSLDRTKPTWPEAICLPTHQSRPGTRAPKSWMWSPDWKLSSSGHVPWQSVTAEARPTAAGRAGGSGGVGSGPWEVE